MSASRGVPLRQSARDRTTFWEWDNSVPGVKRPPTHTAYPVALAEARERVIKAAREYREWDGNRDTPNREGIYLDTRKLIETRAELDAALTAVAALEAPDTEGGSCS